MSQSSDGQYEFENVSGNQVNSARLSAAQNESGNIASASASASANQESASVANSASQNVPAMNQVSAANANTFGALPVTQVSASNTSALGASPLSNLPPSPNLNSNNGPSAISPGLNSLAQNLNASLPSNSPNIEYPPTDMPPPTTMSAPKPTITFAPLVPPTPVVAAPAPTPTAAEVAAAAAKAARSKKQSEADAGQAAMLNKLRNRYATEFANIPEKKRPKAKAYVARAAYYKEGAERNAYINEWIRKDREAAEVRMGQRKKPVAATKAPSYMNSSLRSSSLASSSAASNTRNITKKLKFYPSADPLRSQVIKARKHLDDIADHVAKRLVETATDSKTRRAARQLRTQMRKYTTLLAKEVRHQASALERAAKARARAAYRTYRNTGSTASASALSSANTNRTRKSNANASSNIVNSYND